MDRSIVWSYGGGTQSVAIVLLIERGELPKPECIVISNTTREATETWEYTITNVLPIFERIGLSLEITTSHGRMYYHDDDTLPLIPAYTSSGQIRLFCSAEWKRDEVYRYLRSKGYGPKRPVILWLGMSLDEVHRMKPGKRKWATTHFPLIQDRKTYRGECIQIVLDAGLPPPPKSSCWMCPYRLNPQWRRLREHYPSDWRKAVQLDCAIRKRDSQHNLYLHKDAIPLDLVDLERPQESLFDGCDGGYCEF